MDLIEEFSDFLDDTEDENVDIMELPDQIASQVVEVIDKMINAEQEQLPFDPRAYLENIQSSIVTGTPFSNFQIETNPKSQHYWTNNWNYINEDSNANQNNNIHDNHFQREQSNTIPNLTNSNNLNITTENIITNPQYNITQENNNNYNNDADLMDIVTDMTQSCSLTDDGFENSTVDINVDRFNPSGDFFVVQRLNRYIDTINKLSWNDLSVDTCLMVCQSLADDLLIIAKTSSHLMKTRVQSVLIKGGKLLSKLFDEFGFFSVTNVDQLLKLLVSFVLQQKFDSAVSQMELFDFLSDFTALAENTEIRQCLFDNTILVVKELMKKMKVSVEKNGSFVKYEDSASLYNGFLLLEQIITTSAKPNNERKQMLNFIQLKCIEDCTKKLPFLNISFLAAKVLERLREKYYDDQQEIEDMEF